MSRNAAARMIACRSTFGLVFVVFCCSTEISFAQISIFILRTFLHTTRRWLTQNKHDVQFMMNCSDHHNYHQMQRNDLYESEKWPKVSIEDFLSSHGQALGYEKKTTFNAYSPSSFFLLFYWRRNFKNNLKKPK